MGQQQAPVEQLQQKQQRLAALCKKVWNITSSSWTGHSVASRMQQQEDHHRLTMACQCPTQVRSALLAPVHLTTAVGVKLLVLQLCVHSEPLPPLLTDQSLMQQAAACTPAVPGLATRLSSCHATSHVSLRFR